MPLVQLPSSGNVNRSPAKFACSTCDIASYNTSRARKITRRALCTTEAGISFSCTATRSSTRELHDSDTLSIRNIGVKRRNCFVHFEVQTTLHASAYSCCRQSMTVLWKAAAARHALPSRLSDCLTQRGTRQILCHQRISIAAQVRISGYSPKPGCCFIKRWRRPSVCCGQAGISHFMQVYLSLSAQPKRGWQ